MSDNESLVVKNRYRYLEKPFCMEFAKIQSLVWHNIRILVIWEYQKWIRDSRFRLYTTLFVSSRKKIFCPVL